ncbi:ATP-binding protein [Sporosarcina sp. 179-K 3D1 HS]|uniref:ATP-binding protein n=1 Tax=Sporosarcina sp. 179-K 3D1 HS TaxID=3232169 RepID=UPI0039A1DB97
MKDNKENVDTHLSFLIDNSLSPSAILDMDGLFLHVNDAFREQFDSEQGKMLTTILAEPNEMQWTSFDSQTTQSAPLETDMSMKLKNGDHTTVKVKFMPILDKQQAIMICEVPDKHDLSEKSYLHAFRHAKCFMIIADNEGTILQVNDKTMEFVNLPKDYFTGRPMDVLFLLFSEQPESIRHYIQKVRTYGCAEMWKRFERSQGDARHYHITSFYNLDTEQFLIRIYDQTELIHLEEKLAHSDSLSTVGELAASIAHEIRNPMTALKGFIQLLRIATPEDSLKYLSVIDGEIERMESILSEMLLLSKPATSKQTIFSLEVLVNDMIQVVQPKALMEGITIIQKETSLTDSLVIGDAAKLKQAILNLLKNAFEAISNRGIVTVSIDLDEKNRVVLSITDTGEGMSMKQIKQMFMPFVSSKPEGTGLGLPFVLKTVESHGGEITVQSEINSGTTISLYLPSAHEKMPIEVARAHKVVS